MSFVRYSKVPMERAVASLDRALRLWPYLVDIQPGKDEFGNCISVHVVGPLPIGQGLSDFWEGWRMVTVFE